MGTRRERVVLELDDQFTAGMARAAAASELFQKSLGRTSVQSDKTGTALRKADTDTQKFSATVTRSTRDLDSYSGRLGILASSIGALGPAAVPITAVAIPAVAGLAQELGFAALAGGTAILAFQGVGDALTAMNKAHLDPTAANLEKARKAMEQLSPAAQDLVRKLESMRGELGKLKDAAGSGILPGATAALADLEKRLPIVERILHEVSAAVGDALRDGAASLAGPEWDKFFRFIATEARPELTKLAKSIGNIAHGLAEMWIAFGPLNSDFSSWMLKASRDFNSWATGLSKTQGFADFVAYIRENGPRVADAVGSIANAMLQIVEAAAPIGGPVLHAISAVADAIAAIADSPLGTPIFGAIAAFSALSLAMKAWSGIASTSVGKFVIGQQQVRASLLATVSAQERATLSASAMATRQAGARRAMVGMGAQAAVLGLMMSGVTGKVGLNNTAMLGLAGSLAGPWGAAAGAAVGLTMDLSKANDSLSHAITSANAATASNTTSLKDLNAQRAELVSQFAAMTNDESGPFGFFGKGRRMISLFSGDVGQTTDAIGALDQRVALTTAHQRFLATQMGLTAKGYNLATASVEDFDKALASSLGLLDKRDALRNYQAALDAVTQSIKDNGKSLDIHTEKGRNNQAALDGIASAAITAAEKINDPIARANFLEGARKALIAAIEKFGVGHDKAKVLADDLLDLGKMHANPTVDVDTSKAAAKIRALRAQLIGLNPNLGGLLLPGGSGGMTTSEYNDPTSGDPFAAPKKGAHADGGFIRGAGGPRDDAIPAMISNGEFVVNAAATAQNRGLLEQINSQRFADGGYASRDADMQRYQSRQGSGSSSNKMTVSLGDVRVFGTLHSKLGPIEIEGIATAAAVNAVNDSAALDTTHARMFRGEGPRG